MKTVLVVVHPFADYAKGDHVSDAEEMEAALETNETHVVRTHLEDDAVVERPAAAKPKRRAAAKQPAA
jgi:hypothetical protein